MNWQRSGEPGMDLHDALRAAASMVDVRRYLEIGVDGGESINRLLHYCRPEQIVLCDLWRPSYCGHGFVNHEHVLQYLNWRGLTDRTEFLDGDSTVLIPQQLAGRKFDLITVDGGHDAGTATKDLENTWPLLCAGGLLAFDDVNHAQFPHLQGVLKGFLVGHADAELIPENSGQANTALLRKRGMRLELGCGAKPTAGYTHQDRWQHSAHVDMGFDLESLPWPLEDESCEELLALDVFEHLRPWACTVQQWLDECWRVLAPCGVLDVRLPAWNNPYSFCDPSHYRSFHHESFLYWCPDAPGTVFQNFGRYYFGPEYAKWWQQESCTEDPVDFRWKLRKLAGRGSDGKPRP